LPKDDPLQQTRPAPRALFLNRENMRDARENWWRAFCEAEGTTYESDNATARSRKDIWDVAWAAAIAAHSYIWEGRVEPGR
jgi:hypothetical protein